MTFNRSPGFLTAQTVQLYSEPCAATRSGAFADRREKPTLSAAIVIGVFISTSHTFSKFPKEYINLVAGLGVEGDAHYGPTVQHVSDKRKDPDRSNLRQVHLLDAEILAEVN